MDHDRPQCDVPLTIVVAGIARDEEGRVLLARRPDDRHMGGLWEFPGGKVRAGEGLDAALARELAEELTADAVVGAPLTFAVHEEEGLRVLLLFYSVTLDPAQVRPTEGQEIAWVAPADLGAYPSPPADAALIESLAASG